MRGGKRSGAGVNKCHLGNNWFRLCLRTIPRHVTIQIFLISARKTKTQVLADTWTCVLVLRASSPPRPLIRRPLLTRRRGRRLRSPPLPLLPLTRRLRPRPRSRLRLLIRRRLPRLRSLSLPRRLPPQRSLLLPPHPRSPRLPLPRIRP